MASSWSFLEEISATAGLQALASLVHNLQSAKRLGDLDACKVALDAIQSATEELCVDEVTKAKVRSPAAQEHFDWSCKVEAAKTAPKQVPVVGEDKQTPNVASRRPKKSVGLPRRAPAKHVGRLRERAKHVMRHYLRINCYNPFTRTVRRTTSAERTELQFILQQEGCNIARQQIGRWFNAFYNPWKAQYRHLDCDDDCYECAHRPPESRDPKFPRGRDLRVIDDHSHLECDDDDCDECSGRQQAPHFPQVSEVRNDHRPLYLDVSMYSAAQQFTSTVSPSQILPPLLASDLAIFGDMLLDSSDSSLWSMSSEGTESSLFIVPDVPTQEDSSLFFE